MSKCVRTGVMLALVIGFLGEAHAAGGGDAQRSHQEKNAEEAALRKQETELLQQAAFYRQQIQFAIVTIAQDRLIIEAIRRINCPVTAEFDRERIRQLEKLIQDWEAELKGDRSKLSRVEEQLREVRAKLRK